MSSVRHKRALPVLGISQPIEHPIERDGERADLVCSGRHGEPFTSCRAADPARSTDLLRPGAELLHRSQCPADHPPRDCRQGR